MPFGFNLKPKSKAGSKAVLVTEDDPPPTTSAISQPVGTVPPTQAALHVPTAPAPAPAPPISSPAPKPSIPIVPSELPQPAPAPPTQQAIAPPAPALGPPPPIAAAVGAPLATTKTTPPDTAATVTPVPAPVPAPMPAMPAPAAALELEPLPAPAAALELEPLALAISTGAPPSPTGGSVPTPLPPAMSVEALKTVQAALSAHPWLLGLPELAFFRSFIVESAQRLEGGEVERHMRMMRTQVALAGSTPRTAAEGPSDDQEVEAALRRRASTILPRRIASPDTADVSAAAPDAADAAEAAVAVVAEGSAATSGSPGAPVAPGVSSAHGAPGSPRRSEFEPPRQTRGYTQYVRLTSGPVILLESARLSHDLVRADREGAAVYVLMWMVDSLDRCVGGVASWPLKELKEVRTGSSHHRPMAPLTHGTTDPSHH